MIRQYSIAITDEALLLTYKKAGVENVKWITEEGRAALRAMRGASRQSLSHRQCSAEAAHGVQMLF